MYTLLFFFSPHFRSVLEAAQNILLFAMKWNMLACILTEFIRFLILFHSQWQLEFY